jgi:uncharacterized membrane protein YdjX (TVP38/TMEM64 family)
MQFVQVFVALIPGEFVEIGLGFTFGSIFGTFICFAGIFAASSVIFLTAKKFGISKSTVHMDVTLQNGKEKGQPIPESIEIKGVFLSTKNPVVRLGLVIK